jgi:hypothetical protein
MKNESDNLLMQQVLTITKIQLTRILLIFVATWLFSCETGDRYIYIEVVYTAEKTGDSVVKYMKGRQIFHSSDSAAYIDAYVKYTIARLTNEALRSSLKKIPYRTIGFILVDRNGKDLSKDINFKGKTDKEKSIEQEIRDSVMPFMPEIE